MHNYSFISAIYYSLFCRFIKWNFYCSVFIYGNRRNPLQILIEFLLLLFLCQFSCIPSERPRVAGVYANRLRLNMLLQADPTTAYGLGESFDGNLRRKHLDDEGNPYNTYKHPGLPPGPICSPGLACLKAAANPEQHDYIYFVARGEDGSHVFSTNLAAHNKAVREYWAKRRGK